MFFVGLDIHQKFIYGTILGVKNQIINQGKFGTNEKELFEFLGCLPNKQTKIVLESCGIWIDIYELLEGKGFSVVVANPYQIKAIAHAKIKTDKIDSHTLAKLLKGDLIPETYVPPKDIRELRDIVRHRICLVKMRTMIKNRIHAILRKDNTKSPFKDIFAKKARSFLLTIKDPKINSYLTVIDALNLEINEIKQKAKSIPQFLKQANLLKTMPGIGEVAAYLILAEIGDIHRFRTAAKLCSYAGIVPSISQSGNKSYMGKITKRGSKFLRWILVQCAQIAINKPNKIQLYFYKLNDKKPRNVAVIATARKMLHYMWFMLKNNKPYLDDHIVHYVSEARATPASC